MNLRNEILLDSHRFPQVKTEWELRDNLLIRLFRILLTSKTPLLHQADLQFLQVKIELELQGILIQTMYASIITEKLRKSHLVRKSLGKKQDTDLTEDSLVVQS